MALPNPLLTFQQSTLVLPLSTNKVDVVAAIKAAINEMTGDQGWTAGTVDGDVAATPATLISAPAGSGIPDFRAILGFADGTNPTAARMLTPATRTTNDGFLTIGPDGRSGSTNWYDANPFGGGGERNSGFWQCAVGNVITGVWCCASEETLLLGFRNANDNQCSYLYLGAIVEGVNAGSVEADDRLYGMAVMDDDTTLPTGQYGFGANRATWLQASINNGGPQTGIFSPVTGSWVRIASNLLTNLLKNGSEVSKAFDGSEVWMPIMMKVGADGITVTAAAGRLRGLFWSSPRTAMVVIQDADENDKAYAQSGSLTTRYNAFVCANEP